MEFPENQPCIWNDSPGITWISISFTFGITWRIFLLWRLNAFIGFLLSFVNIIVQNKGIDIDFFFQKMQKAYQGREANTINIITKMLNLFVLLSFHNPTKISALLSSWQENSLKGHKFILLIYLYSKHYNNNI